MSGLSNSPWSQELVLDMCEQCPVIMCLLSHLMDTWEQSTDPDRRREMIIQMERIVSSQPWLSDVPGAQRLLELLTYARNGGKQGHLSPGSSAAVPVPASKRADGVLPIPASGRVEATDPLANSKRVDTTAGSELVPVSERIAAACFEYIPVHSCGLRHPLLYSTWFPPQKLASCPAP
ncbi:hypothetical protein Q8A73_012546 [Channa argus]|nr:hypothetical protein Q8A73_012546 [Channa argus]